MIKDDAVERDNAVIDGSQSWALVCVLRIVGAISASSIACKNPLARY